LDIELAIGGVFDAISAGLKHGAEEAKVYAIAGLDEEGVFIEWEFFAGKELKDGIEVFAKRLGKVGVGERCVLRSVFTARERSKLRSVGAQVDSRNGKCSSGHGVFSLMLVSLCKAL
jgi:hypothetical protein